MKPISILAFAVLAVLIGGCAERELDSAREQWEEVRPAHYSFTYEESGFAPHIVKAIEVRGSEIVGVTCTGDLPTPCNGFTIDELFDWVERSVDEADVVKYDPEWHFPAAAGWSEGEEVWGFVVRDFAKLE